MIKKGISVNVSGLLILGITFKENCPDVRNTKIVDVIRALEEYGVQVTTYDPWADPEQVAHEYKITSIKEKPSGKYDAIVLGVAHKEFIEMDLSNLQNTTSILYDVKGVIGNSDKRL